MGELDSASADPRVISSAHIQGYIFGKLLAGLRQFLFSGENQTGHYQGLGPRTALHEPAVYQHLIKALLFRHWKHGA